MAQPPIQFFRKEDFPEIADEPWAQKLFVKLNAFTRQTQYGLSKDISVAQNMAGFWWEGLVGNYADAPGIIFPFSYVTIPEVTPKQATAIKGFPFIFKNEITPKRVKGVFVAQSFDVTNQGRAFLPAMLSGVAWEQNVDGGGDVVKVYAINGMLPKRCYQIRLLVLSE